MADFLITQVEVWDETTTSFIYVGIGTGNAGDIDGTVPNEYAIQIPNPAAWNDGTPLPGATPGGPVDVDAPTGGGGLTQPQVDARVTTLTADKLDQTAVDARVLAISPPDLPSNYLPGTWSATESPFASPGADEAFSVAITKLHQSQLALASKRGKRHISEWALREEHLIGRSTALADDDAPLIQMALTEMIAENVANQALVDAGNDPLPGTGGAVLDLGGTKPNLHSTVLLTERGMWLVGDSRLSGVTYHGAVDTPAVEFKASAVRVGMAPVGGFTDFKITLTDPTHIGGRIVSGEYQLFGCNVTGVDGAEYGGSAVGLEITSSADLGANDGSSFCILDNPYLVNLDTAIWLNDGEVWSNRHQGECSTWNTRRVLALDGSATNMIKVHAQKSRIGIECQPHTNLAANTFDATSNHFWCGFENVDVPIRDRHLGLERNSYYGTINETACEFAGTNYTLVTRETSRASHVNVGKALGFDIAQPVARLSDGFVSLGLNRTISNADGAWHAYEVGATHVDPNIGFSFAGWLDGHTGPKRLRSETVLTALTGAAETSVVVDAPASGMAATPTTGTARVTTNSGAIVEVPWTDRTGATLTIAATDFSGDPVSAGNVVEWVHTWPKVDLNFLVIRNDHNHPITFHQTKGDSGTAWIDEWIGAEPDWTLTGTWMIELIFTVKGDDTRFVQAAVLSGPVPVAQDGADGADGAIASIIEETTTARTLSTAEGYSIIRCTNAAETTITIPTDAVDDIPVNSQRLIKASGAGGVTLDTTGITLDGDNPDTSIAQNGNFYLVKYGPDAWMVE